MIRPVLAAAIALALSQPADVRRMVRLLHDASQAQDRSPPGARA
jgi:hypothetical protein